MIHVRFLPNMRKKRTCIQIPNKGDRTMSEMQVFSLTRKSVPVRLSLDGGKEVEYSIRELDGQQRDKILADFTSSSNYDSVTGEVKVTSVEGLMARLLEKTLYDDRGDLVPFDDIQSFPASAVDALYEISADLNGFVDKKKKKDVEDEDDDSGKE
jgi:hypothetical protein